MNKNFRKTIETTLPANLVKINIEEWIEEILSPLKKHHLFGVELNGSHYIIKGVSSNAVNKQMTPEHKRAYLEEIPLVLNKIKDLIIKNKERNSSYKVPVELEISMAQETVTNAFQSSFEKTKDSYKD